MSESFSPSGGPTRQIIQRVVEHGPAGADPLHLRREGDSVSTAAYVNLFHRRRWRELTGLSSFALEAAARGPGRMRVFGVDGPGEADPAETEIPRREEIHSVRLEPGPDFSLFTLSGDYDFYFFDWRPDQPDTPFPAARYTAETRSGTSRVKLALVVTTYDRLRDVEQLAAAYAQARRDWPEIRELTELTIVNNRAADRDRLAGLEAEGVRVATNSRNTGGAGGFGLGARLAVEDGGFTHVLFMDDDVSVQAEAWLRTLNLLRNLTEEHRGQIIGGGMFTRERPTFCHTLAEALDHRGYPQNLIGRMDLSELPAVLTALAADPERLGRDKFSGRTRARPYAAWWYCVIPVEIFREHGYPLPVFFRGDDQEFGLRVGRKVLSLNGICVWHPDFDNKRNLLRAYLGHRNWAIYTTLHCPRRRARVFLDTARRLARHLADNDYQGAALLLTGFDDFVNFHQRQDDGEAIFEKIAALVRRDLNRCEPFRPDEEADRPEYPRGHQIYSAALVILTFGGALIPGPFFRRRTVVAALPHLRGKFPARRTVALHEPTVAKTFQRGRAFWLTAAFLGRALNFLLRRNVKKDLEKTFFPEKFQPASGGPGETTAR